MTKKHILPQKPFYLIRHGETHANVAGICAGGTTDAKLTENGILQAKILADKIKNSGIKPSKIYHSSLSRARDTANYINHHLGIDMVENHNLVEHKLGDWENEKWENIKHFIEEGAYPPNGESHIEFAMRVQTELTNILNINHDEPPMIVAHGGTFHSFHRLYGVKVQSISNCEMHFLTPNPQQEDFPWIVNIIHQN